MPRDPRLSLTSLESLFGFPSFVVLLLLSFLLLLLSYCCCYSSSPGEFQGQGTNLPYELISSALLLRIAEMGRKDSRPARSSVVDLASDPREQDRSGQRVWSMDVPRGIVLVRRCHSPAVAAILVKAIKAQERLSIIVVYCYGSGFSLGLGLGL